MSDDQFQNHTCVGCQKGGCQGNTPAPATPAPPPGAREMFRMALGLTVTCAIAAAITGIAFVLTEPVKKENQLKKEQLIIRQLLSLPEAAEVTEVSRLLVRTAQESLIAYLTPGGALLFNAQGELKDKLAANTEEALA